ncbi:MAG: zinc ribbon domain-containing protein [Planctomycetota bacterium]|jgi:hypothetical protein|nr:zinc ribbon domain-containing protein [Planctomycetota bacterium]
MLFVYGSREKQAVLGNTEPRFCPSCQQKASFTAWVDYRYFHLWHLLCFIYRRRYFTRCNHCRAVAPVERDELRGDFSSDNIPIRHRAGWIILVFILGSIVVMTSVNSFVKKTRYRSLAEAPVAGDIYLADLAKVPGSGFNPTDSPDYKEGDKNHGALLLLQIGDDYLLLATTLKAFPYPSQVDYLLRHNPEYDRVNMVLLKKTEVVEMFEAGIIWEVRRPPPSETAELSGEETGEDNLPEAASQPDPAQP